MEGVFAILGVFGMYVGFSWVWNSVILLNALAERLANASDLSLVIWPPQPCLLALLASFLVLTGPPMLLRPQWLLEAGSQQRGFAGSIG